LHGPELAALSGSILFPQSASGAFTSIRLDSTYFALFRLGEIRLRFGGVNAPIINRRVFCGLSRQEIFEKLMNAQDLHEFKMIVSEDSQNMGLEYLTISRFFKVNFGS
jgi:hypothetical protein